MKPLALDLSDLDLRPVASAASAASAVKEQAATIPFPTADPPQASAAPSLDGPQSTEIFDPTTGELVPCGDIDQLIDAYERIDGRDKELYAAKSAVKQALLRLTEGDTKTRRIQGHRRKAVLTLPADKWHQEKLKEAWNAFPHLRDQCLKIGTISVALMEFKKLLGTSGTPDVNTFRDMLAAANEGPSGLPSVKVEA